MWPYERPSLHPSAEHAVSEIFSAIERLLLYAQEMLDEADPESSAPVMSSAYGCQEAERQFRAAMGILSVAADRCVASRERYVGALNNVSYQEYLNSWHWSCVRKKAKKAAKGRCQVCNAGPPHKHLEVHHRTYVRRGEEEAEDVTVLCGECHKRFHENGKLAQEPED